MTKIRSIMLLLAALAISVAMPLRASAEDITILNAGELRSFRDEVNAGDDFAEKTVILAADVDLAGEPWIPIGTDETPFAGKFNGGNHTISGLRITTEVMRDLTVSDMKGKGGGLFLNVEGENAQIANLTVKGSIDGAPRASGRVRSYTDALTKRRSRSAAQGLSSAPTPTPEAWPDTPRGTSYTASTKVQ